MGAAYRGPTHFHLPHDRVLAKKLPRCFGTGKTVRISAESAPPEQPPGAGASRKGDGPEGAGALHFTRPPILQRKARARLREERRSARTRQRGLARR